MSNSSTGLSSNEVIYRFKLHDTLSSLTTDVLMNFTLDRAAKSKKAEKSLAFTQLSFKIQYDWHHCLLAMKVKNLVYIHLHWEYSLPGLKNRKFTNQRADSFSIKRKIESLTYKLKLSEEWKIHSVIFITQLKSALKGSNLYKRLSSDHFSPVIEEDNFYELKWLLNKRMWRYEWGKPWTEYLVKWKGYEPEFEKWYSLNQLKDVKELIQKYEEAHRDESPLIRDEIKKNCTERMRIRAAMKRALWETGLSSL